MTCVGREELDGDLSVGVRFDHALEDHSERALRERVIVGCVTSKLSHDSSHMSIVNKIFWGIFSMNSSDNISCSI